MNPALQSLAFDTLTVFRPYSLRVSGQELLREVGAPGNRYGVEPGSITLTHAGPGEVSSLAFTITDPLGVIGLSTGMVEYRDNSDDVTLFLGFIDGWAPRPLGLGRAIDVTCKGIEALLDWMYCPNVISWAAGADIPSLVQSVVGQSIGVGFALNTSSLAGSMSTSQYPVSSLATYGAIVMSAAGTAGPGSLRAVLQTILDSSDLGVGASITGERTYSQLQLTVDFTGGLRVWGILYPFAQTDYFEAEIAHLVDVGLTFRRPMGMSHQTTPGDATRGVYVKGGNAAGSGAFSDGSGVIGPWAVIQDSNSLTAAYASSLARSYLSRHGIPLSGKVTHDMGNVHQQGPQGASQAQTLPGATFVQLTDPTVGLAAFRALLAQVDKTFAYGDRLEQWDLTYGQVQSGASYLRQLTRAVVE